MKIDKKRISETVMKLEKDLEYFRLEILKCNQIGSESKFISIMNELHSLSSNFNNISAMSEFEKGSYYKEYRLFFREMYFKFTELVEMAEVKSIDLAPSDRKKNVSRFRYRISNETQQLMEEESSMIDFSGANTFLMVGSGYLPESVLQIQQNTELKSIIGVDSNPAAISISENLVGKLALKNICFSLSAGEDYDYSSADVILIALMVTKKVEVLRQIAATIKVNTQVLLRIPDQLFRMLYGAFDEGIPKQLVKEKETYYTNLHTRTILFRKV